MKYITLLALYFFVHACSIAGEKEDYFTVNPKTGKIAIERTISVAGSKHDLFKNVQQFVAVQNFDGRSTIKTKDRKVYYNDRIIDKSVSYIDEEKGKLFGQGYVPWHYRDKPRFAVLFDYKIYIKDNEYRYILTNFIVREFVDAGRGLTYELKGETGGSDARILDFPLEEFKQRSRSAFRDSEIELINNINEIRHTLKTAMKGEL